MADLRTRLKTVTSIRSQDSLFEEKNDMDNGRNVLEPSNRETPKGETKGLKPMKDRSEYWKQYWASRKDHKKQLDKRQKERNRKRYNEYAKQWRIAHPDFMREWRTKERKEHPEKERARQVAIRKIPLQPCAVCGTIHNVGRHHPDYSKPLDVICLCSHHHKQADSCRAIVAV